MLDAFLAHDVEGSASARSAMALPNQRLLLTVKPAPWQTPYRNPL